MTKSLTFALALGAALSFAGVASANVAVTAATGGTSISADKATNGVAAAFTTLGNIVITEQANGDFASQTSKTLILTAPSGWRFNAGTGSATAAKISGGGGGSEVAVNSIAVTASSITVTITVSGTSQINSLTISGIQVQATEGGNLPASGNIFRTTATPGTATITGITNDSTNFGTLSQVIGTSRLMYLVLPGQAFTDASTVAASGISGTPSNQTAGIAFNLVKLIAADRQFNIDTTYAGAKTISYSGPGGLPSFTTAVSFSSGQSSTILATTLRKAETTTITATDGTVAGTASSNVVVNAGAFTKLQSIVPGEIAAPGTASGKSGAPSARAVGGAFSVVVNAVDANWNLIATVADTVHLISSDADAALAADATLVAGTKPFNVTFNTAGSQMITVTNLSDNSILPNTSPSISVNKTSTTTTVTSFLSPTVYGQATTFTATVLQVAGSLPPTGSVTFKDGASTLGSEALVGNQAVFTIAPLSVGNRLITGVYSGDGNYNTSTSVILTQTVTKADTSTELSSSLNPTVFGQPVTLTATVSASAPGVGIPTGTVTFKDGATTLGSGALGGGQATLITAALTAGTHTAITATYNSDANFSGSVSTNNSQTVLQADTTTTVTSSANPSVFGQSVTFTATVSPVAPGAGTRTGTVTFTIDGTPQTPAAVNVSGQATIAVALSVLGGHTISAMYNGDGNFTGSTSTNFTQTVNAASTSTTISSSANPSPFGSSVTFTGTVSAVSPGAGTRTGTVTFNVDGAAQAPASVNGSGLAVVTVAGLSMTNHTIVATYSGDANFTGSTSTNFIQVVTTGSSTVTVASAPNPSVFGQSVTFTATVNPITATGTITFRDGLTTLGSAPVVSAQATFITSSLSVSNHLITVVYNGDDNLSPSTSSVLTQVVNRAASATGLSSSANPVCIQQPVTFTAVVSAVAPGAGTPTGSVTFRDGVTVLGSPALSAGSAALTTSALTLGTHTITATYNGNSNFASSVSVTLTQVVSGPVCLIIGSGSLCGNSTGNLYTAPAGMTTYSWLISGSGSIAGAANAQSVSVNAGASGSLTLSLTVTDTNACNTSTCSTTVSINALTAVTVNPTNRTACSGNSVSFTAAASGSPSVQWQASTDGGVTFTNITGATSTTYTFTAALSQNGNQYRAVFRTSCGTATTTAATLTVNVTPVATITADAIACRNSTGNIASVPNAGAGASYVWSISGGTITAGAGTSTITYTAGTGGMTLNVTVSSSAGCTASGSKGVGIASASTGFAGWSNVNPVQWQTSTFNPGSHQYSDGNSIPFRFELNQLCDGAAWCIVLEYDFSKSTGHFIDSLATYDVSENTVHGQECANHACSGVPTTYPIPTDTNLTYQLPGVFTVYNGTITNVSSYTTVSSGSFTAKQITISGVADPGGAKDVLILVGFHLARENEWGTGNAAHSMSGASPKVSFGTCPSASSHLSFNPGGLIPQTDVAIFKTGSPNPVCPGGVLTYSIVVTNIGPDQATSVAVTDPLPRGTSLVSATPSFTGTTNLSFALGSLNAGSKTNITIIVNVATNATGSLTNTATVSAAAPAELISSNNTATAITVVASTANCLISGPNSVCPSSTNAFSGPAGMIAYGWTISGNGSIIGSTTSQTVSVNATVTGSYTLGLAVTGTNGCSGATCQQIVAVINAGAPLLTCAVDRQLQCGESTDPANTGTATATGACGGGVADVTFVDVAAPANCTGRAGVDRIWTATNLGGQSSICTQHITFVDTTPPVITCSSNVTVTAVAGHCYASGVTLGTPLISDNCSATTLTNNAPSQFPVGTTLVTWTAMDGCGNAASCPQTVTVIDDQLPTINCPANIVTNVPAGPCPVSVNLGTPETSDNCSISNIVNNAPAEFPDGTTAVIWTAIDASGNQSTCTQQVVVTRSSPIHCYKVRDYDLFSTFGGCFPQFGTDEKPWPGTLLYDGEEWLFEANPFANTGHQHIASAIILRYVDSCLRELTVPYYDGDATDSILWRGVETGPGTSIYVKTDGCAPLAQVILDPCVPNQCPAACENGTLLDPALKPSYYLKFTCADHATTYEAELQMDRNDEGICQWLDVFDAFHLGISCDGNARTFLLSSSCFSDLTVTQNTPVGVFAVIPNPVCCGSAGLGTVEITEPLAIFCPPDITRVCATGLVLGEATTTGGCTGVVVTSHAPASYAIGTNSVPWTAMDDCQSSVTCTQRVIITGSAGPSFAGLEQLAPSIEAASLSWSAATPGTNTYKVYQGTASGAENFSTPVLTTTNLSAFVSPLSHSITYFFVVRATDACGTEELNTVERSAQPLVDPAADSDGDGIPDWYELQHGLDPNDPNDANRDSDGDGLTNLEEYLAGTDPMDSASCFKIDYIVREGLNIRIAWMTGIGKTNALQRRIGAGNDFTDDFSDIFTVTNTVDTSTNYLDTGAASFPAHYYRVRLVP